LRFLLLSLASSLGLWGVPLEFQPQGWFTGEDPLGSIGRVSTVAAHQMDSRGRAVELRAVNLFRGKAPGIVAPAREVEIYRTVEGSYAMSSDPLPAGGNDLLFTADWMGVYCTACGTRIVMNFGGPAIESPEWDLFLIGIADGSILPCPPEGEIPEPSTWLLMACGTAWICLRVKLER